MLVFNAKLEKKFIQKVPKKKKKRFLIDLPTKMIPFLFRKMKVTPSDWKKRQHVVILHFIDVSYCGWLTFCHVIGKFALPIEGERIGALRDVERPPAESGSSGPPVVDRELTAHTG